MTLLRISGLSVAYQRSDRPALYNVSLEIAGGDRVAVLGESGSGKSTLALAVAGLLPTGAMVDGEMVWPGFATAPSLGGGIGFVFQDPSGSLDPLMRVGDQVAEVVEANLGITGEAARSRVMELLAHVQLPDIAAIAAAYPHQLSGGQKQRVAIACAIAGKPRLLVADEPTSALDTIVQADILALLDELVGEYGMALILITHDIAVAARNAERIAVLQGGRLIEVGLAEQLVESPQSQYARQLVSSHIGLDARPRVGGDAA